MTPHWMTPELLRRESTNTKSSDVHGFGSTYSRWRLKHFRTKSHLFLHVTQSFFTKHLLERLLVRVRTFRDVLQAVADRSVCKRPVPPSTMPENNQSIMKDFLEDDATQRPSFNELDMRLERVPLSDMDVPFVASQVKEASLQDIFPPHIAEAMNAGRQTSAEYKNEVTPHAQRFSDVLATQ